MQLANTPMVEKIEDFGYFDPDYNPFEFEQIFWSQLITQLLSYPFLFVALVFLAIIYPFLDLFYILSFNMPGLYASLEN